MRKGKGERNQEYGLCRGKTTHPTNLQDNSGCDVLRAGTFYQEVLCSISSDVYHQTGKKETKLLSEQLPREGNGNPLQDSCLENPMDRGAWWATAHTVAESRTQLTCLARCSNCKKLRPQSFFVYTHKHACLLQFQLQF